jgi:uncharacterized protein (TIGR02646 family)
VIHIKKTSPPSKFISFIKETPNVHFDDLPSDVKDVLRKSLLQEQGYLCAYCMSRIYDNHRETKIEHYHARTLDNELDYSNLLAVCTGNSVDNSPIHQHCDTKKGEQALHINPQNPDHISMISYKTDGTIFCPDNPEFDRDLNDVLNLNDDCGYLKINRKNVLQALQSKLHSTFQDKKATIAFLQKTLKFYKTPQDGKLQPYCGILIDYIEKKLKSWS